MQRLTASQEAMLGSWERHTHVEFVLKDASAALATMSPQPYVFLVPTGTGAAGRAGVHAFYADSFLPNIPPDFELLSLSQTLGENRLIEEFVIRFTHSIEMGWMLPDLSPTGRRVEAALFGVIQFDGGKIAAERLYWDQATVLSQLGIRNHPIMSSGVASAAQLLRLQSGR
jgi:carboxymethylenebutenolidase